MEKSSGVLLHISSLPGKYGIGSFSEDAYDFVDFLKSAGQKYWQILPLGVTGFGNSPYQSFSAFAGNPFFISLDALVEEGCLTSEECNFAEWGDDESFVDYEKQEKNRMSLLKKAYARSDRSKDGYIRFKEKNKYWLDDYALFMALKESFGGMPWNEWEEDIRLRDPEAMAKYSAALENEIEMHKYIQYLFFSQWSALKRYANKNGVKIIGDIPIYAAFDSADAWSAPKLFQFDKDNRPIAVAGCPPDSFAPTGQLWGNPLYNWEAHEKSGFEWWSLRIRHMFLMYDALRIDHFRGFDEYYSIPYGRNDAVVGHWEKGPGMKLFNALHDAIGENEVIAEDLGFVTDSVRQLVKDTGFANMKVLEFAFDSRDTGDQNDYLPHNYPRNCVAYTGTHDNQTLVGWFDTITDDERKKVRKYLCDEHTPDKMIYKPLIGVIMRSRAKTCIIPMQDWLGFDDSARMNTPSTVGDNWRWRVKKDLLTAKLSGDIAEKTKICGRWENKD